MELEREAKSNNPKLPKLKITPFKGTVVDWIRFENIFLTQIDKQPISDEEKFWLFSQTNKSKGQRPIGKS